MDYVERIKKINSLAKSLKDNNLAGSMDEAVKMAEKIVGGEMAEEDVVKEKSKEEQAVPIEESPAEVEERGNNEDIEEEDIENEETRMSEENAEESIVEGQAEDIGEESEYNEDIKDEEKPEETDGHAAEEKAGGLVQEQEETGEEAEEKEEGITEKPVQKHAETGFFDRIKEKFSKKDLMPQEEVEKELKPEAAKGFFEKIIDRFRKKDEEEGFEEVNHTEDEESKKKVAEEKQQSSG